MEQLSRHENLIIAGLPASYVEVASSAPANTAAANSTGAAPKSIQESSSDTVFKVITYLNKELNVQVDEHEISVAHRLPGRGVQPIFVRFVRRRTTDLVYRARTALKDYNSIKPKGQGVYINEDLSPNNRSIFQVVRRMKGTTNGIESVRNNNF